MRVQSIWHSSRVDSAHTIALLEIIFSERPLDLLRIVSLTGFPVSEALIMSGQLP
jgi:hypothetical protein